MNNIALVIFSADINDDLWEVDNFLINKYWPSHPSVYLLTETKKYKNFKTINFNYPIEKWTKRIRESLAEIKEEYIIFMSDDIFFKNYVDEELLLKIFSFLKQNKTIANINFELSFDKRDKECNYSYLKYRPKNTFVRISLLYGLWDKEKLISLLNEDCSPWEIEKKQQDKDYDYYILNNKKIISWFNDNPNLCGGIFQGKWHSNTISFLKAEGIDIKKLHTREEV